MIEAPRSVEDRVEVLPGDGTVVRFGQVTAWVAAGGSEELIWFLVESIRNVGFAADGGRVLVDHIASVLEQADPEPDASFATLGPGDGGWSGLVHGAAVVDDGVHRWTPPSDRSWTTCSIGRDRGVAVVPLGQDELPPARRPAFDFEAGVVPGRGFLVFAAAQASSSVPDQGGTTGETQEGPAAQVPSTSGGQEPSEPAAGTGVGVSGPSPSEPSEPSPPTSAGEQPPPAEDSPLASLSPPAALGSANGHASEPVVSDQPPPAVEPSPPVEEPPASPSPAAESQPGAEPEPVAPPGPASASTLATSRVSAGPGQSRPATVSGVRCPAGHLNHPAAVRCAYCRLAIDDRTSVSGPRPAIGVLTVDDGTAVTLDRSYVVGSDPEADPVVATGAAGALWLDTGGRPAHLEVRVRGWDAVVITRGSGDVAVVDAEGKRAPCAPFRPEPLGNGFRVEVAGRVLSFATPWPGTP